MKTVTAKQARQNFSELLNEVYYGGVTILITRSGKPMVTITGVDKRKKVKKYPSLQNK